MQEFEMSISIVEEYVPRKDRWDRYIIEDVIQKFYSNDYYVVRFYNKKENKISERKFLHGRLLNDQLKLSTLLKHEDGTIEIEKGYSMKNTMYRNINRASRVKTKFYKPFFQEVNRPCPLLRLPEQTEVRTEAQVKDTLLQQKQCYTEQKSNDGQSSKDTLLTQTKKGKMEKFQSKITTLFRVISLSLMNLSNRFLAIFK